MDVAGRATSRARCARPELIGSGENNAASPNASPTEFALVAHRHRSIVSAVVLAYLGPSAVVMLSYGRVLNVLQLDEAHSTQLGVDVDRTKLVLIGAASLATAAAVAFSGLIGFVGLISPHAVRLVWGPDHRSLIPMAAIVGAGFMIVADLVARTVVSPSELPVGIVTAFCGAPFFLYLLRRRRGI